MTILHNIDRWSALAGLRFLLALVVVCSHLGEFSPGWSLPKWIGSFGAFEAILGFLLVSGYSVGLSCIKEPDGFLKRRFLRIYPVYFFSILFTASVECWHLAKPLPSPQDLVCNLFFLNQILTTDSFVGPSWTLALEVWLYCLCPILTRRCPGTLRLLCWISFGAFAAYTWSRSAFHLPYYAGVGYGGNLLFLSFAWLCGLRLAIGSEDRRRVLTETGLLFLLHILVQSGVALTSRIRHHEAALFLDHNLPVELKHTLLLLLILAVVSHWALRDPQGRRNLLLRFLGDISYPMYLLHFWLLAFLYSYGVRNSYAFLVAVVAFSSLAYLLIDRYSQHRHLRKTPIS